MRPAIRATIRDEDHRHQTGWTNIAPINLAHCARPSSISVALASQSGGVDRNGGQLMPKSSAAHHQPHDHSSRSSLLNSDVVGHKNLWPDRPEFRRTDTKRSVLTERILTRRRWRCAG